MHCSPPIGLAVAVVTLVPVNIAEACACCDSLATREVLGWNDRGEALVEFTQHGCETFHALEVWSSSNTDGPVGCYDLFAPDVSQRVGCESLTDGWERFYSEGAQEGTGAESALDAYDDRPTLAFDNDPLRLSANALRASLEELPPRDDDESYVQQARLEVSVRTSSGFQDVFARRLTLGASEYDDNGDYGNPAVRNAISVTLELSPSRTRGLLRVEGHNTAPGMGHFPVELFWVDLESPRGPVVASTTPVYALPAIGQARPSFVEESSGARLNRIGLRRHRRRDYAASARYFATAVLHGHTLARFNLACAYARLDAPSQALVQLGALAEGAEGTCSACRRALRRARSDDDLAPLRSNPTFRRLVGTDRSRRDE